MGGMGKRGERGEVRGERYGDGVRGSEVRMADVALGLGDDRRGRRGDWGSRVLTGS